MLTLLLVGSLLGIVSDNVHVHQVLESKPLTMLSNLLWRRHHSCLGLWWHPVSVLLLVVVAWVLIVVVAIVVSVVWVHQCLVHILFHTLFLHTGAFDLRGEGHP